jgi:hypothetical protein
MFDITQAALNLDNPAIGDYVAFYTRSYGLNFNYAVYEEKPNDDNTAKHAMNVLALSLAINPGMVLSLVYLAGRYFDDGSDEQQFCDVLLSKITHMHVAKLILAYLKDTYGDKDDYVPTYHSYEWAKYASSIYAEETNSVPAIIVDVVNKAPLMYMFDAGSQPNDLSTSTDD